MSTLLCSHCGASNQSTARFCYQCGMPLQGGIKPVTGLLSPQSVLSERYVIIKRIGQGGMAAVYKATDLRISGKIWVVKEMSDAALTNPADKQEALAAFKREAELLSRLSHPGIPRVTDFFSEGSKQYLAMEFIEGETLEDKLTNRNKPFTEAEVVEWAKQLCEVLAYLHSRTPPIIFRDLKPANIMVDQDGHIKLIDFGIARLFQPGQSKDTVAFGTDGFAPIEQYGRGQTDARSDIYALGATLYTLLTGEAPPPAVERMVQNTTIASIRKTNPGVHPEVEQTITRCLELQPQARFQTTKDLQAALQGRGIISPPPPPPPKFPKGWVIGGIVAVVLAGLLFIPQIFSSSANPTPTRSAEINPTLDDNEPSPTRRVPPTSTEESFVTEPEEETEEEERSTSTPTPRPTPTKAPTPRPTPTKAPTPRPTPTIPPTNTPTPLPAVFANLNRGEVCNCSCGNSKVYDFGSTADLCFSSNFNTSASATIYFPDGRAISLGNWSNLTGQAQCVTGPLPNDPKGRYRLEVIGFDAPGGQVSDTYDFCLDDCDDC